MDEVPDPPEGEDRPTALACHGAPDQQEHGPDTTERAPVTEGAEWVTEWAVEVTWLDWKKAGAKGPTSQYGPFATEQHRNTFLDMQRRDPDIAATRIHTRVAAYTPWTPTGDQSPTTQEERERLYDQLVRDSLARRNTRTTPAATGQEAHP